MTTPPAQPPAPRRLRRVGVVFCLCVLSVVAAWYVAGSVVTSSDRFASPRGDMAYNQNPGAQAAADMGVLTSPVGIDPLTLNPARRPLDHEPGKLPPFPDAKLIGRYVQADGDLIDEVSHWRITQADPSAVQRHYEDAARRLGWETLPKTATAATPPTHSRTYIKQDLPMGTLTVRVSSAPGDLHITVWLRYAITPGFKAG